MNVEGLILSLYIFSVILLLFFILGIRRLFTLSWSWPLCFFRSALFLVLSLLCLMVANQLNRFFPVFPEYPIANVSITKVHDKEFRLNLVETAKASDVQRTLLSPERSQDFSLKGDQWQLDIRVLTWHPLLAEFGLKPLYKLERLNGRYHSIEDEQSLPRSLYELDSTGFSHRYWQTLISFLDGSLINSYYGSAVYAPLADSAEYGVFLSPSGTELKPLNKEAQKALTMW